MNLPLQFFDILIIFKMGEFDNFCKKFIKNFEEIEIIINLNYLKKVDIIL